MSNELVLHLILQVLDHPVVMGLLFILLSLLGTSLKVKRRVWSQRYFAAAFPLRFQKDRRSTGREAQGHESRVAQVMAEAARDFKNTQRYLRHKDQGMKTLRRRYGDA